ncbi:MAG: hypothetical protein RL036_556 [Actinomycetota bacterium]|jgi:hypothetical protein
MEVEAGERIPVRFVLDNFNHAFYESVLGGKDNLFSVERASRMPLISTLLENSDSLRFFGKGDKRKGPNLRRCALIHEAYDFVLVLEFRLNKANQIAGRFITCYRMSEPQTLGLIRSNGEWNIHVLRDELNQG